MNKILFDNFANNMADSDMHLLNPCRIIGWNYNTDINTIFHTAAIVTNKAYRFRAYLSSKI